MLFNFDDLMGCSSSVMVSKYVSTNSDKLLPVCFANAFALSMVDFSTVNVSFVVITRVIYPNIRIRI